MGKVIVEVEKVPTGGYAACVVVGDGIAATTGKSLDELKRKMRKAVEGNLEVLRECGDAVPADFADGFEFVYKFDAQSLLAHYSGIFTNAALQRLTGINQRQLQHYASGISRPRAKQEEKITTALHALGTELLAVSL